MSFLKSIFFGSEGSYTIFGTNIRFEKESQNLSEKKLLLRRTISSLYLGYMHALVHEMGHALAIKIFTKENSSISIYTDQMSGETFRPLAEFSLPKWKKTVILLAGPMLGITFDACRLIAAIAPLKKYTPIPLHFPILLWWGGLGIINELAYVFFSGLANDSGDFGRIRRLGPMHLTLSTVAIVSEVALAILLTLRLSC